MKDDASFDEWLRKAGPPACDASDTPDPGFRREVWRRIEAAALQREPLVSTGLWSWLSAGLAGPRGIVAAISCMALAGGFAGILQPAKNAAGTGGGQEQALQAYTRSISPFLAHSTEP